MKQGRIKVRRSWWNKMNVLKKVASYRLAELNFEKLKTKLNMIDSDKVGFIKGLLFSEGFFNEDKREEQNIRDINGIMKLNVQKTPVKIMISMTKKNCRNCKHFEILKTNKVGMITVSTCRIHLVDSNKHSSDIVCIDFMKK
jgi:hypothetical protein